MGSRYEVEVTVGSASNLKNVNWRNGDLRPYAVLWVDDDGPKCSTLVDPDNGEDPAWDEKVVVPVPPASAARLGDAVLHVDVVHAASGDDEDVKPLVGSARLLLRDVLDDAGGAVGGPKVSRTLRLKRPSGRPQGRVEVRVAVREAPPPRYYDPAPAYGNPAAAAARDPYYAAPPVGSPAAAAAAPPPYGGGYGAAAYGDPAAAPPAQKSSKMGMGTGLAVGAAAGLLGGLALAEGASYLEDKVEDRVAERVEEETFGDGDYDDDY
ncbi:unnamed protein product [Miscanthus lutarioriparius]|uniref:C2 domain-containing protein n=1 Tax=Miscanthus lutarioriparius TaxID=422564 RepID=A0A811PJH4_9POAL|nr:unnamed protein product [Miscanthus lutarioriparius]